MKTKTENAGAARQAAETGNAERGAGPPVCLLTKQEMADRLQVDLRTVERWMAVGVLRPLRILGVVRFDWAEEVHRLKASYAGQGGGSATFEVSGARAETSNAEHSTTNPKPPIAATRKSKCGAPGGKR